MKLTENFTFEEMIASETARRRRIGNIPEPAIIGNLNKLCAEILQPVRNKLGEAIRVTSGYRSGELNNVVGGSPYSQHLKGEAADIISRDNRKLWQLINDMIKKGEIVVGQLIDEKNLQWIHISLPNQAHHNEILKY